MAATTWRPRRRERGAGRRRRAPILEARQVTRRFGGLRGRRRGRPRRRRGRDRRADRAQRRRQDHVLQLPHRPVRADRGRDPVRRQARSGLRPDRVTKAGIARTFQNIRLFANMTALENVLVGRHCRTRAGVIVRRSSAGRRFRREERESVETRGRAAGVRRPGRHGRRAGPQPALRRPAPAGDRPGPGHRARAAPARRADGRHEPAGDGRAAATWSQRIRDQGLAIVVIEHDMRFIMGLCDRVTVLDPRREAGRGHARPRSSATPGDRGLPRAPSRRRRLNDEPTALLGGQGPAGRLRQDQAVKGIDLRRRAGRGGHPDRRQRRRQDDDPAHHVGAAAGRAPATICFEGQRIDRLPAHEIVEPGARPVAGGPAHLPAHDASRENLRHGGLHPPRRGRASATDIDRVYDLFPILTERPGQAAGHPLRRRAADAGHGPGADGPARAAAAGRAVDGAVAPIMMQTDLRHDRASINDQGTTILLVEQNAAQALSAGRPRLRDGDRQDRPRGPRPARCSTNEQVRKAYLGEE